MQKKKKIRLGCSDFKSLIESNAYYVDKSLFIEEVINANDDVMLIPRPRRFGKTLNLSMLRYFFDVREPENKSLFTNLKIWQCDDEIKSEQGKYPVIYVSFRNAKGNNWEECREQIITEIVKLYREHRYLLEGQTLYEDEKAIYNKILNKSANNSDYKSSIETLSEYLYRLHNKRVVILMDEYDAPIQSAYKTYYNEAISFMRSIMGGAFKDNINLHKGVITGILRVSRESIFSDVNNIGVFSITRNKFAKNFGFNETEVKAFFEYFGMNVPFGDVADWYDGYKFGDISGIYNPWSIIRFVSNCKEERKIEFVPHWVNTSSNNLIKDLIKEKGNALIRSEILKLINDEEIEKNIDENFVFPELKQNEQLIWTLFLFSGYVTVKERITTYDYKLRIPNYELKTIFKRTILDWFKMDIKVRYDQLTEMANSLINNNLTVFEKNFKEIMGDTFSYYDTAKNNEYVFHAYMLGLLAVKGDDYILKSNRESGDGRYDIMLVPKNAKEHNGVVIEIKRTEKQQENEKDEDFISRINKKLKEAESQIYKNKYYKELLDNGLSEGNIVTVPIVFADKEPYVNELKIKS